MGWYNTPSELRQLEIRSHVFVSTKKSGQEETGGKRHQNSMGAGEKEKRGGLVREQKKKKKKTKNLELETRRPQKTIKEKKSKRGGIGGGPKRRGHTSTGSGTDPLGKKTDLSA